MALTSTMIALLSNGDVKGVGYNGNGQLGLTHLNNRFGFVDLPIHDIKGASCGGNHIILVTNDGYLKCAGYNAYGQLGNGNKANQQTFVTPSINTVQKVACGGAYTMVIKKGGNVFGSGYNSYGQLGNGTTTHVTGFSQIPIHNVKTISCGDHHTIFLLDDGTVKCAGHNGKGQLGIGNTDDQHSIVDIPIENVKKAICGNYHTIFLMNDGTVKGVGENSAGQLGIGNTDDQHTIIDIPIANVKDIACGRSHTMFLMNDGTVKGVGENGHGHLGIGSTRDQHSIVDIPIENVKKVICGNDHTIFLLDDGTIMGAGLNSYGQVGIGNTIDQPNIVKLPISDVKIITSDDYDNFEYFKVFYLIKHLNKIYKYENNTWVETTLTENDLDSSNELAKSNFETHGMVNLSLIPFEKLLELGTNIEILSWSNSSTCNPSINIPEQNPIRWFDNLNISTWTNAYEVDGSMNVSSEGKIRYAISKNGVDYDVYKNDMFIRITDIKDGMTKEELSSIPSGAWRDWVDGEAHKHKFMLKIGLDNQSEGLNVQVKNVEVNFFSNQGPVIIDPAITPDSVHAEFARFTASVKDLEGDSIEYRILIKKAGETGFEVTDDWSKLPSSGNVLRAYNKPYFNLGTNKIKIEARDQRGLKSEWIGTIAMTNQKPFILYTYNDFGFVGTISDEDEDAVSIQISIDDNILLPFTNFMQTPKQFKYEWDTKHTPFGKTCTVKIELKDTYEEISEFTFDVTGRYKSLMFKDEDGNYYTTDKGEILKMLDLGRLILGQKSEPKKITLVNQANVNLNGVKVFSDNGTLPDVAQVKLSLAKEPFIPLDSIDIPNIFIDGTEKEFYAALHSNPGRGRLGAEFSIKAQGRIIE